MSDVAAVGRFLQTGALLVAAAEWLPLQAMDTDLRLGPNELVVGAEILNEYVDQGSLRHDDVPARVYLRGRVANLGLELDTVFGISEDDRTGNDPLEIVETDLRLDYLISLPDLAQILPYLEAETYPSQSRPHDAVWLGVQGWYLLPYEGFEVGGQFAVDLTGDVGWRGSIGARQLFQDPPFDVQSYQLLNFGNDDYHEYTSGADDAGITTFEVGALATLPLPYESTWATFKVAAHFWIMDEDRARVEDDVELVIAFGLQYRLGGAGFNW